MRFRSFAKLHVCSHMFRGFRVMTLSESHWGAVESRVVSDLGTLNAAVHLSARGRAFSLLHLGLGLCSRKRTHDNLRSEHRRESVVAPSHGPLRTLTTLSPRKDHRTTVPRRAALQGSSVTRPYRWCKGKGCVCVPPALTCMRRTMTGRTSEMVPVCSHEIRGANGRRRTPNSHHLTTNRRRFTANRPAGSQGFSQHKTEEGLGEGSTLAGKLPVSCRGTSRLRRAPWRQATAVWASEGWTGTWVALGSPTVSRAARALPRHHSLNTC